MSELNPDHPATKAAHDNWHKIVALIMFKQGLNKMVISTKKVSEFAETMQGHAVVIEFKDEIGIILQLVTKEQAEAIAKREGGTPS